MKRSKITFLRTTALWTVIFLCLSFGLLGCARVYESTRKIAFGDFRPAIKIDREGIKFFDYEINW